MSLQSTNMPLECILRLYARGPRAELYCNYYQGFKKLAAWLGPFDIPDIEYKQLPTELNNWECNELANILGTRPEIIFHIFLGFYQER